jgi:hypothetical protein
MEEDKKKTKKESKVTVFGHDIGEGGASREERVERIRYRRRHGSLAWGLFFIVIGILVLLSNLGSIPPIAWANVLRFWPVIIILIGVDTLFGHSDVADLITSIIALFIFATILGVIFLLYTPQLISGLPVGILNYLHSIVNALQIR